MTRDETIVSGYIIHPKIAIAAGATSGTFGCCLRMAVLPGFPCLNQGHRICELAIPVAIRGRVSSNNYRPQSAHPERVARS